MRLQLRNINELVDSCTFSKVGAALLQTFGLKSISVIVLPSY